MSDLDWRKYLGDEAEPVKHEDKPRKGLVILRDGRKFEILENDLFYDILKDKVRQKGFLLMNGKYVNPDMIAEFYPAGYDEE